MSNIRDIKVGRGGKPSRRSLSGHVKYQDVAALIQSAIPSGANDDDGWYYADIKIDQRLEPKKIKSIVGGVQGSIRNYIAKYHPGYKGILQTVPEDAIEDSYHRIWFKVIQK